MVAADPWCVGRAAPDAAAVGGPIMSTKKLLMLANAAKVSLKVPIVMLSTEAVGVAATGGARTGAVAGAVEAAARGAAGAGRAAGGGGIAATGRVGGEDTVLGTLAAFCFGGVFLLRLVGFGAV